MGRGKLVFKGDEKVAGKKKKKKSKHSSSSKHVNQTSDLSPFTSATTSASVAATTSNVASISSPVSGKKSDSSTAKPAALQVTPTIQQGTGSITSSSTVITGHGTKFTKTINIGDAIIVKVNNNEEMRIVKMRLSDISIAISTPFSHDLTRPTSFQYISKPKDHEAEKKAKRKKEQEEKDDVERLAFGTYTGRNNQLVYRERTEHGSYRIRRETLKDGDVSRSNLLQMRTQKKSDKFC